MINIENFVFDAVADELRAQYPGIFVTSLYVDVPARFPAVTVLESSNVVLPSMSTTVIENAARVMFEVNVYSNLAGGAKAQARDIIETVDRTLARLGFTRVMMNPVSNLQEATIFRIIARYEAVVSPELGVDGTTFRIYTR